MKKTYIIPSAEAISFEVENMVAASPIQSIAGDSGLQKGTGETPTTADVKTNTVEWEKWD